MGSEIQKKDFIVGELVVPKNQLRIQDFRGSLLQPNVSGWLEKVKDGNENFPRLIPNRNDRDAYTAFASKWDKGKASGWGLGTGTTLGLGSMVTILAIPGAFTSAAGAIAFGITTVASVGSGIWVYTDFLSAKGPLLGKRREAALDALEKVSILQAEGLRLWLKARYNLTVTPEALFKIGDALLARMDENVRMSFRDTSGELWIFNQVAQGREHFVESAKAKEKKNTKSTRAVKAKVTPEPIAQPNPIMAANPKPKPLPPVKTRVEKAFDKLVDAIGQLDQDTVEGSHTVERLFTDAQDAVKQYKKLATSKVSVEAEKTALHILDMLSKEADILLDEQLNDGVKQLRIHGSYIATRQQFAGIQNNTPLNEVASADVEA
jgi:hypothetical protein